MDISEKTLLFWVLAIVGFFGIGWFYSSQTPEPESVHSTFLVDEVPPQKPPKGFQWEPKEGVDYWEIWVSEDANPDNAELKATTDQPTATCEDVQVCGKDRWIFLRSDEGGVKSQFATLHWPSL